MPYKLVEIIQDTWPQIYRPSVSVNQSFMQQELIYKKVILSENECNIISNYILENENFIKSLGPDIYPGTTENSLTGRYSIFNFLNIEKVNHILEPKLRKIFNDLKLKYPIYVQCWANTYRKGDYINPHKHNPNNNPNQFMSANIFLQGNVEPGTKYFFNDNVKDIKNKKGEIFIFDSTLVHSVSPYQGNDIRITIAMDIHNEIEKYYSEEHCKSEYEFNKIRYYKFE